MKMILQVFVLLATSFSLAGAFSNGKSIANGPQVIKNLYCGREPLRRIPIHLNVTKCDGYCHARTDVRDKFTITVNSNTYWGDTVNVTISSVSNSDYIIKGFAVSAINDVGTLVGLFKESNDTTVGICYAGQKAEGNTIFHTNADPSRKSITLQWDGPSQNYNDIKFRAWIVHSHDQIFYLESAPLHSRRNGSKMVDLQTTLVKLLGRAAQFKDERLLDVFEKSFMDRQLLGFPVNLDDPFDPLKRLPRPSELIPAGNSGARNVQPSQTPRKPDTLSSNEVSGKGSPNLDPLSGSPVNAPQGQQVAMTPGSLATSAGTSEDTTTDPRGSSLETATLKVAGATSSSATTTTTTTPTTTATTTTTNGAGAVSTLPGDVNVSSNGVMNSVLSTATASSPGSDVNPAFPQPLPTQLLANAPDDMMAGDVGTISGNNTSSMTSSNGTAATTSFSTSSTTTSSITTTITGATTITEKPRMSDTLVTGADVGVATTTQSNDTATTTTATPTATTNSAPTGDVTIAMSATAGVLTAGQVATQQPDRLSNTTGLMSNVSAV